MLLSVALAVLSLGSSRLDSLRSQIGVEDFHRAGVTGKGVIIGLSERVNFALWDFRNPDGSTRFLRHYGRSRREIDSLLRAHYPENRYHPFPDSRTDTLRIHSPLYHHGTAVLSIAAGNGQAKGLADLGGKYLGVAPEADLVAGDYDEVRALADSLGRPFVFNHSYQSNLRIPPDSGTAGKIAVIAAGNSHVYSGRHLFAAGDTSGYTLRFRPASRDFHRIDDSTYLFDVWLRFWYPDSAADSLFDITLHSPNDTVLTYRVDMAAKTPVRDTVRGPVAGDAGDECDWRGPQPAEAVYIDEQDHFRWVDPESRYGLRYRVKTRAYRNFTLTFKRVTRREPAELILPSEVASNLCERYVQAEEFRDELKGTMTLLASLPPGAPVPDQDAIHVGAYARQVVAGPPLFDPVLQRAGDIVFYSGRGDLERFGVVKPEIVAPAHTLTALGNYGDGAPGFTLADSVHALFDGTSAAAPVVTGAVALLLQMAPTLDAAGVKTILRENARTDAFTGAVPNSSWGYGKLHLDWDRVRTRLATTIRPPRRAEPGALARPLGDRLRILLLLPEDDPLAYLEIRDLQGRSWYRTEAGMRKGRAVREIDISLWPAGVYLVGLHTRAGGAPGRFVRAR